MIRTRGWRVAATGSIVLALAGCTERSQYPESMSAGARRSATSMAPEAVGYARMPASSVMDWACPDGGPEATDRPDLVGKPMAEVRREERAAGHTVRIAGSDGSCSFARTQERQWNRVSVYTENGIVRGAQMG